MNFIKTIKNKSQFYSINLQQDKTYTICYYPNDSKTKRFITTTGNIIKTWKTLLGAEKALNKIIHS